MTPNFALSNRRERKSSLANCQLSTPLGINGPTYPFGSIISIFYSRRKDVLRGMPIIDIHRNTAKLRKQCTEPSLRVQISDSISSAVEDNKSRPSLRRLISWLVNANLGGAVVSYWDLNVFLKVWKCGRVDFGSCIFHGLDHCPNLRDVGVFIPSGQNGRP